MVTFQIPFQQEKQGRREAEEIFRFSVARRTVLLAGSRYGQVPQPTCLKLIHKLHQHGFGFFVGCASGVDRCFRETLAKSPYSKDCFVGCAFKNRLYSSRSLGLYASVVVPDNLPPKAALHRRTLWLVKRSCMVVLFADNPKDKSWGKGSSLVFRSAMYHLKPVFVVSSSPPKNSIHYRLFKSKLFGVVEGYWAVPHPFGDGGMCDDEY